MEMEQEWHDNNRGRRFFLFWREKICCEKVSEKVQQWMNKKIMFKKLTDHISFYLYRGYSIFSTKPTDDDRLCQLIQLASSMTPIELLELTGLEISPNHLQKMQFWGSGYYKNLLKLTLNLMPPNLYQSPHGANCPPVINWNQQYRLQLDIPKTRQSMGLNNHLQTCKNNHAPVITKDGDLL